MQRPGAPRKTSAAEDRLIVTSHRRDRFKCAAETSRNWVGRRQISYMTVLRRLAARGIKCRRPVKKPRLSDHHRAARLTWATRYRRWTQQQWSNIIFSDEKCFVVDKKDSRKRCFRKKERFHQQNIHHYGPKRSIMIWAAISADGKSDIIRFNGNVTSRRYVAEALQPALIPFVNQHNRQMTFMHDKAPGHRAHATRGWLATHNIPVFGPWPSKSPDMNPIENLWAQLQRAIDNRPNRPQNEAQLWRAVQEEWRNVNMWDVRRLIFFDAPSMHSTCAGCRGTHEILKIPLVINQ